MDIHKRHGYMDTIFSHTVKNMKKGNIVLYLSPYLQACQKRWRRRPSIEADLCQAACRRKWSEASYKVAQVPGHCRFLKLTSGPVTVASQFWPICWLISFVASRLRSYWSWRGPRSSSSSGRNSGTLENSWLPTGLTWASPSPTWRPAQFLTVAGCSTTKLWPMAKEAVGLNGHHPISTYNMQAMGLTGFVTAWG